MLSIIPMFDDACNDEKASDQIDDPKDGSDDGSNICLKVIIRYFVPHGAAPNAPHAVHTSK